jgi:predicted Zn-dependent peptidase
VSAATIVPIAVATVAGADAVTADPEPRVNESIIELPSGLTLAVEPMSSTRAVSIGVWVGVGARDEPAHLCGVSHFLEHLLFKGTERRSARAISEAIDRVGGDINAFTSKEYTAYYCRVPGRHVDLGIELLGDVISQPLLRDDDLENERQVILEELAMDDDDPDDVAHRVFSRQVFGDHPLGRETAGERSTVAAITADDVREFHAGHYRAGNTVVAIAGAVDPSHVCSLVQQAFDPMPAGDGRVQRHAPGDVTGDAVVPDDTEQVHMIVGGRSLCRDDADREALDVVNHVLGGGLSSRLFDEIRERRGLAYSVFSGSAAFADSGAWSIYAGTLPEHAGEVRGLIDQQLDQLIAHGITDHELEIAVGYLMGSYEMGLEDSGARMSRLGGMLTTLGDVRSIESQLARWGSVSHDDVTRVIDRVYAAAPPLTVTVGPDYRR